MKQKIDLHLTVTTTEPHLQTETIRKAPVLRNSNTKAMAIKTPDWMVVIVWNHKLGSFKINICETKEFKFAAVPEMRITRRIQTVQCDKMFEENMFEISPLI